MKIIVCGKGGSGKSTVSVLLSRALNKNGFNVLLIDADESNLGLHYLMGAEQPVVLLDDLGGKKGLKQKTASTFPGMPGGFTSDKLGINDISARCITDANGVKLLKIGKIHSAGEGCACPMGRLSKMVFSGLELQKNDVAVVDTAAGVEHFGRGLDEACDLVLAVIDPSYESFLLAEKISGMAEAAGLEYYLILNKIDTKTEAIMANHVDMTKVIGRIDYHEAVFLSGLEGKRLDENLPGAEKVVDIVHDFKKT